MNSCLRVFAVLLLVALAPASWAQTWIDVDETISVDPGRGVDPRVDYESLALIGAWDDRNYDLTLEHLELLGDNEQEIGRSLPAFFRVLLRQWYRDQGIDIENMIEYPLSGLNIYLDQYGGYFVDGKYYRGAKYDAAGYRVNLGTEGPDIRQAGMPEAFVEGDVRVTWQARGSAESAVAINPVNPDIIIAGVNGSVGQPGQVMHYSHDGGNTWNLVNLPLGSVCCDPTVAWSSDGQYAYAGTLGFSGSTSYVWFYRSSDFGVTWSDLVPARRTLELTGVDREYMHVDQSPTSPYQDNIYMTWHKTNAMRVGRSSDFGETWSTAFFLGSDPYRGIGGDITTDRNGKVYFAWPAFVSKTIRLAISEDGGATFPFANYSIVDTTNAAFDYAIPSQDTRKAFIYIAADTDRSNGEFADSVYISWADLNGPEFGLPSLNHSQVKVAYSRDGGETWTITIPHETEDVEEVDRWHPFMVVGDDGVVHVIFNDTRNSPDRTAIDVYYSYSEDGAQTWSVPQKITSEISPSILNSFEFGDYSGAAILMNDLMAIYTDNRDETGQGFQSRDVYVSGVRAGEGGWAGRIPGSLVEPGPGLRLEHVGDTLELSWPDACGLVDDYAVYAGSLGNFGVTIPRTCTTDKRTEFTLPVPPTDQFFLVVPQNIGAEGSYGQDSSGAERPPSALACLPQGIRDCE